MWSFHKYQIPRDPKIILPTNIRSIGERAFSGISKLEFIIPEGCLLDSIGNNVFEYTELDSIVLPETITAIELQLFWQCAKLEYADLSKTQITFLPQLTFGDCDSLKKVLLPPTLDSISNQAFQLMQNHNNLDTLVIYAVNPPKYLKSSTPFFGDFTSREIILEVPKGSLQAYMAAGYDQWFTVKEMEDETPTSVASAESGKSEMIAYPNPVNDILYLQQPEGSFDKGYLIDNLGRIVKLISLSESSINVAMLPKGIYHVIYKTENGIMKQKIYKE
jgi:hypothetical protein